MTPLAFLGQLGDAIDIILHKRESVAGGIQVGGSEWLTLIGEHLRISAVALAVACAIAIPLGLWLGHIGRGDFLASSFANIGRAVPTYALIAFFVAYIGIGFQNVALALTLLAIPPIFTNAYVGMRQVDRDTVDAGRGMGLTGLGIVRGIELPLALPILFGGIRISAVNVVATATLGPIAGVDDLGKPIINANVYGSSGRLAAAIIVALLAIGVELAFAALQRAVTPAGLKLDDSSSGRRRRRLARPAPLPPAIAHRGGSTE